MDQEVILEIKRESEGTWTQLVIYKDDPIPLNKSLLELQDISAQKVDQSKTITIPSDEAVNQAYFGSFEGINNGIFNPYTDLEAKITMGGDILIRGLVYFKGYKHKTRQYTLLISGKAGNIRSRMGEKTLRELITTTNTAIKDKYDHDLTYANVVNTWYTGVATHTGIFYPLNDIGNGYGLGTNITKVDPYNAAGDGGAIWDITQSNTPIPMEDLRPSINVIEALTDIFTLNGFTLDTSNFTGSPLLDAYTLLKFNGSNKEPFVNAYGRVIPVLEDSGTVSSKYIPLEINVGENISIGDLAGLGDVDVTVSDVKNDILEVKGYVTVPYVANLAYRDVELRLLARLGGDTPTERILYSNNNISAGPRPETDITWNIDEKFTLVDDETFRIRIVIGGGNARFATTGQLDLNYYKGSFIEGRRIDNYLASLKQYDFVKGILSHLGLYIDYNVISDSFILSSYNQLDTGITKDWTDKIEYINELEIRSLTDFISPAYLYETAKMDSYLNDLVLEEFDKDKGEAYNYGSLKLDMNLQVAAKESKYKSLFSPCMVEKQAYSLAHNMDEFVISRSFKEIEDPKITTQGYELFFKLASDSGRPFVFVRDENLDSNPVNISPVHSMQKDGLFCGFRYTTGFEIRDGEPDIVPTADLFSEFHSSRWEEWIGLTYTPDAGGVVINETKLKEARILNGQVWLTPEEFADIKFGDKISINTGYGAANYRILSISGFDLYERKPATVRLIKIV